MLGLTAHSIKSIEAGPHRMSLSLDVAQKAVEQFDVSFDWLLANNPRRPPVDSRGSPYTQATFDRRQAELKKGKKIHVRDMKSMISVRNDIVDVAARVAGILVLALERGEYQKTALKLRKTLGRFVGDKTDLMPFLVLSLHGPLLSECERRLKAHADF